MRDRVRPSFAINVATKVSFSPQGYVCSESVLLATCQEFGIEIDDKIIPRSLRSLPATP
jgi:hypothetical protein